MGEKLEDELNSNKYITRPDKNETKITLQGSLPPIVLPSQETLDNDNYLYVYDAGGMNMLSILNKMSDFYMSKVPTLLNRFKTELQVDTEFDIIDCLLVNNVEYGKFIVIDYEINFPKGMYHL